MRSHWQYPPPAPVPPELVALYTLCRSRLRVLVQREIRIKMLRPAVSKIRVKELIIAFLYIVRESGSGAVSL